MWSRTTRPPSAERRQWDRNSAAADTVAAHAARRCGYAARVDAAVNTAVAQAARALTRTDIDAVAADATVAVTILAADKLVHTYIIEGFVAAATFSHAAYVATRATSEFICVTANQPISVSVHAAATACKSKDQGKETFQAWSHSWNTC